MTPPNYEQLHDDYDDDAKSSEHSFTSSSGSDTATKPHENQAIESPAFQDSKSPNPKSHSSTAQELTAHFVCTFCWKPQYPPSRPKLVGSSRISCTACWKEVLDLSICWVCGNQIVRGEEVVSLGWCFWHKVCFGCLLCGVALPAPEAFVDVEQGECDGGGKGKGKRKKKQRGVELDSIPLCVDCGTEMKGKSEESILERGLETVASFDDGLSRSRLMRMSEATEKEREADGLSMRWVSGLVREGQGGKDGKRSKQSEGFGGTETIPLIRDAVNRESIDEQGSLELSSGNNEDMYVSVLNPEEAAFKPSKTKPLPKWMSLLPSNRRETGDVCPDGRHSHSLVSPSKVIVDPIVEFPIDTESGVLTPVAETFYPSLESSPKISPSFSGINIKEIFTLKPSLAQIESLERKPIPVYPKTEQDPPGVSFPPRPAPQQIESLTKRPPPTFPILVNKNLSMSSGRRNPFQRAGSRSGSVYFTPLEMPVSEEPSDKNNARPALKNEGTSFPFFQSARQPITPAKESSWAASLPSSGLLPFKGTPLESQSPASSHTDSITPSVSPSRRGTPFIVQSAEFLDRYKPKTPSTPKDKYAVGDVGNIIEKFGGRKSSAGDRKKDEALESVEEEGESGDGKVKDVLRKELKSLFEK